MQTTSLLNDMYSAVGVGVCSKPHLPANICTTDPAAACDRITVGVFVGGDWTGLHGHRIALGACHATPLPETVRARGAAAERCGRRSAMGVLWRRRQSEANCWLQSFRATVARYSRTRLIKAK